MYVREIWVSIMRCLSLFRSKDISIDFSQHFNRYQSTFQKISVHISIEISQIHDIWGCRDVCHWEVCPSFARKTHLKIYHSLRWVREMYVCILRCMFISWDVCRSKDTSQDISLIDMYVIKMYIPLSLERHLSNKWPMSLKTNHSNKWRMSHWLIWVMRITKKAWLIWVMRMTKKAFLVTLKGQSFLWYP